MLETVDGSGSGGVFVDENQASCGSILATGNLHLSPIGAVLQQARKPKPATGERPAIAGACSPKIWDAPSPIPNPPTTDHRPLTTIHWPLSPTPYPLPLPQLLLQTPQHDFGLALAQGMHGKVQAARFGAAKDRRGAVS